MSTTFDAKSEKVFSNVSSLNWSHGGGSPNYAVACVSWAKLGTTTASATYNSTSMGSIGNVSAGGWTAGVTGKAEIFGLVSPSSGTQDFDISWSASGNYGCAGGITFTGVDTASPTGTAQTSSNGAGTSTSTTVSDGDTDAMIVDAIAIDSGASGTSLDTGTAIYNDVGTGYYGLGQYAAGAASVNMNASWTGSESSVQVAIAILGTAGGGGTDSMPSPLALLSMGVG